VGVYYSNWDVRVEERPVPEIGPGELLLRVEACGICGSDVMEWYRARKAPLVLGHEIAGEVAAVGEGVEGFRPGDRVVVAHHVPCNTCRYCLRGHHSVCETLRSTNLDPGGFAEFARVPRINVDRGVFPLPEELTYDEGTFVEPLACVLRGLRMARFQPGQNLLVVGSGISGILFIKAARALGAGRVVAVDIEDYRLKMARNMGADAVLPAPEATPERIRSLLGGWLGDLVAVCTGSPRAMEQSFALAERGGTVLLFAPAPPGTTLSFPAWEIWRDGVSIATSYAGAPADMALALDLLRARRVEVEDMITHRLSLDEIGKGFALVAQARESLKVIVYPGIKL